MEETAKLVLIRGNSGSGKSSAAKALQLRFGRGTLLIGQDEVRRAFGAEIYAYYYDIPFQETLRRHQTKPNRADFGAEEMGRWWKERDYIGFIPERTLTADISLDRAVEQIWRDVSGAEVQTGGQS